jgi:hypothetical protein
MGLPTQLPVALGGRFRELQVTRNALNGTRGQLVTDAGSACTRRVHGRLTAPPAMRQATVVETGAGLVAGLAAVKVTVEGVTVSDAIVLCARAATGSIPDTITGTHLHMTGSPQLAEIVNTSVVV